jgi:hypothetical protein
MNQILRKTWDSLKITWKINKYVIHSIYIFLEIQPFEVVINITVNCSSEILSSFY